jgi:MFS family permease
MQNVTLVALAYSLTRSAWFTGVITFAQLGPMLLLSPLAGALADRKNRRTIMVTVAATQTVLSMALAVLAFDETPSKLLLVLIVSGIGIGAAINAPAAGATLPSLVPRQDLQSAIALNSAAMNASRVAGPILAGLASLLGGAPAVFAINGLTYLFVILAVCSVKVDFAPKGRPEERPLEQLKHGFRAARADRLVSRVLLTISVLSLCSLVFVYQMPLLANEQLGLSGWSFNLLFACFALGAAVGALSMGSFLSAHDRGAVTRNALFVFAVALAVFGSTRSVAVAFPAVFVLGAAYFMIITALSTTLQMQVALFTRI